MITSSEVVWLIMDKSPPPTDRQTDRSYHHGSLVDALVHAAVELIEVDGVEKLSLRAVSKKVGVSPGAPFRHFKTKSELLKAVAEQSMLRLTQAVNASLAAQTSGDPVALLGAIGRGYLNWALSNPTHFQIISSRTLIDFHSSKTLVEQNDAIYKLMLEQVTIGQAAGAIRGDASAHDLVVNARAFVYGLARMAVDRHFREWRVSGDPRQATAEALNLYLRMIATSS